MHGHRGQTIYSDRGRGRSAHRRGGGPGTDHGTDMPYRTSNMATRSEQDARRGTQVATDSTNTPPVVGRCTNFCPAKEVKLRVRERLLHRYEVGGEGRLKPVKEYSRPAAGQLAPAGDSIRTPDTLMDCVRYLVMEVLGPRVRVKEEQMEIYDFVFDRLRAVRQDLVVQRVNDITSMTILSICVRFHLLFGQLLADHPSFSHHINTTHQLDCVKSCLLMPSTTDQHMMESVYLLSNMDSPSAISWAINQPRTSSHLKLSLAISHAFEQGNSVRFYRLVSTLPLFLLMACAKHCQLMCKHALAVYAKGFRAKNARYPISHLASLLWMSPSHLTDILSSQGMSVKEGFVWWTTNQENEDTSNAFIQSYYHEQIQNKVREVIDKLDKLVMGEAI